MQLRYGHARGVVSCAQMAEIPGYGGCPAGAVTAAFPASLFRNLHLSGYHVNQTLAKVTWPAANVTAAQLAALPLDSLNVATSAPSPSWPRSPAPRSPGMSKPFGLAPGLLVPAHERAHLA